MFSPVFILVFLIILGLYGGANYYIGSKIFQGLSYLFPQLSVKPFILIYALVALTIFFAMAPLPLNLSKALDWIGSVWMGAFAYLMMLFILSDVILLLGRLFGMIHAPLSQTAHFYVILTVLIATAAIVTLGIVHAGSVKQTAYEIELKDRQLTEDLRVVMISDIHLGAVGSEKRIKDIVKQINTMDADIVTMVGDIFNDDYEDIEDPEELINQFRSIQSTYGVFASLGNHDGGRTFDQMVSFLEKSNIRLLNEEHVIIDDRFVVVGRLDPSPIGGFGNLQRKDTEVTLAELPDLPVIVLDHTPSKLEQYGEKVDLVLSGHTHRGQLFPFNFITQMIYTVDYGHYQKEGKGTHFIVSSGAGTWGPPLRVGTDNEIVFVRIQKNK